MSVGGTMGLESARERCASFEAAGRMAREKADAGLIKEAYKGAQRPSN